MKCIPLFGLQIIIKLLLGVITILSTGDTRVNKTKIICLMELAL